ncbi:MAG: putative quinol monooxygenase [Akkermansiaceae bacterium]
MSTQDTCCTIVPYFDVPADKLDEFKALLPAMVEQTQEEPLCMFYGFAIHENIVHCREGYQNAEGVLNHIEKIGPLLEQALSISELTRLEIHGPAAELEKLQEPLAGLNPSYYTLELGFRR